MVSDRKLLNHTYLLNNLMQEGNQCKLHLVLGKNLPPQKSLSENLALAESEKIKNSVKKYSEPMEAIISSPNL